MELLKVISIILFFTFVIWLWWYGPIQWSKVSRKEELSEWVEEINRELLEEMQNEITQPKTGG